MPKVAINGMGRIGRAALKVLLKHPDLEVVAINDLGSVENLAYLLKYDTVYGVYDKKIAVHEHALTVEDKEIRTFNEKDPEKLPWKELGIDLVFECTGFFVTEEGLKKHIQAGAKKAILSAPAKSETITTVVYGASENGKQEQIVSCASCTTNCITPVMEILDRRIGVEKATMTTIHAYTSTQAIVDGPDKKDFRKGRAAAANFIPASTGAAIATTKALPNLKGKFDGLAVRGPVPVGSLADIVLVLSKDTSVEELNNLFKEEAQTERYREVVRVTDEPIVSSDIVGDPHASIIDISTTQVVGGNLVKIMAWYDNEWGYTNQMVRHALSMFK